jgi:hypothetical protein
MLIKQISDQLAEIADLTLLLELVQEFHVHENLNKEDANVD